MLQIHLLEKPVNLGSAHVQGSNVVEDSWRDVDTAGAAARAEVDNLGGGLLTIALDSDPSSAVGSIGVVRWVKRHDWRTIVVSPATGTKALE